MAKKLTEAEIITIWEELKSGNNISKIAKKHNVSKSTVIRIKNKVYDKYKTIIDKYENSNKKKIISKKSKVSKVDIFKRTEDELKGILLKLLEPILQPVLLKFVLDNIIEHQAFKTMLSELAQKEYSSEEWNKYILNMFIIILNTIFTDKTTELIIQNADLFKKD